MKRLIVLIIILVGISLFFCKDVKCQSIAQTTSVPVVTNDSLSQTKNAIATTEQHKGRTVFLGTKGGKFVIRKSSKTGNWYRQYLPKEIKKD